jgi:hypothetical protein
MGGLDGAAKLKSKIAEMPAPDRAIAEALHALSAIDVHEGDELDEEALAELVRVAAADRDQARFALFEPVAAAIRRASASAPLLCVLDDLHAADLPSLELAAFATRDLRTSRVAWLLTWRDAEAQRPPVCDLIARVAREAELIPLRRLSANDATQLARDARSETPAAVRDAIVAATAGNPLFLLETLACFTTGETLDVARLPLAQGIGAIVRERLAPLPPAVLADAPPSPRGARPPCGRRLRVGLARGCGPALQWGVDGVRREEVRFAANDRLSHLAGDGRQSR